MSFFGPRSAVVTTTDAATAGAAGLPTRYTFGGDVGTHAQQQRRVLAEILDEYTIGVLSTLGVSRGWQCLDVGAGAGTISAWLADQIGDEGRVTALDLDTQQIPRADNLTVVTGDVRTTSLSTDHYDLILARLVLYFLPDRSQLVRKLTDALRPGGALVIADWSDPTPPLLHAPSPAAAEVFEAFHQNLTEIMRANGGDTSWGPRVPLAMRSAGLTEINTVIHNRLWYGGQPGNLLHLHNSYLAEEGLLARGMTTDQLRLLRAALTDPRTMTYHYPLNTTIGRKPS